MRILIVSLIKLLFSWFSVNTVTGYLKSIEPLNGTNYPSWYKDVNVAIAVCEYDLALHQDKPAEPVIVLPWEVGEIWQDGQHDH